MINLFMNILGLRYNYIDDIVFTLPAGTKSNNPLPTLQSQAKLHIRTDWPGTMVLTDQQQILMLISPKLITDSSEMKEVHVIISAG